MKVPFVPKPRHDIIVEEIEIKEHDGRVRGVGDGIGLRMFFGTAKKITKHVKKETLE